MFIWMSVRFLSRAIAASTAFISNKLPATAEGES
jgi:hypothetical protein